MSNKLAAIMANFKALHDQVEAEENASRPVDGMYWIERAGKRTNCCSNSWSASHGHAGLCNCGYQDPEFRATSEVMGPEVAYRAYLNKQAKQGVRHA